MARVTYVKKAQQRFATKPVIDPATGLQKVTPVTRRNGEQKTTQKGKPVVLRVTEADKTQPLPQPTCGKCGKTIEVGQPYKHISPKSGPYGGRKLVRCEACPTWNVWEYSSSLSARVAEIAHDAQGEFNAAEDYDGVVEALSNAAERVRELAEEKRESAQSIEDGFQHPTYQSEELTETADSLDGWADDIENAQVPDYPEADGEVDCDACEGTGQNVRMTGVANPPSIPCEACEGTGKVDADEPTEEQIDEWKEEAQDVFNVVDECPV